MNATAREKNIAADAPTGIVCAVITVSDTRTLATDRGGEAAVAALEGWGHAVSLRRLVPDIPAAIQHALRDALAAREVDAVVLRERVQPPLGSEIASADAVLAQELRPYCLYSSSAYRYDPASDSVQATGEGRVVKLIDTDGVAHIPDEPGF